MGFVSLLLVVSACSPSNGPSTTSSPADERTAAKVYVDGRPAGWVAQFCKTNQMFLEEDARNGWVWEYQNEEPGGTVAEANAIFDEVQSRC
jgi:hypothetical protein